MVPNAVSGMQLPSLYHVLNEQDSNKVPTAIQQGADRVKSLLIACKIVVGFLLNYYRSGRNIEDVFLMITAVFWLVCLSH